MIIDHANLSKVDLNLLVAFDALLSERSVTRAAARVGLGQSAMSHNLARLRTLFHDELLTRGPDGMRPTPRARALHEPLRIALAQIQTTLLQEAAFDPATAERVFRLGLPDSIEAALMPSLLRQLRETAPNIRLVIRSIDRFGILDELDSDRLDLGIGSFTEGGTHHKRRRLYSETYLCLFSPKALGLAPPIALDDYLRLPHALASLNEDPRGVVDEALSKLNLSRSVVITTPHFLAIPFIISRTAVIATLPARLARFFAASVTGLATSPVPIDLPSFTISLLWHSSHDQNPAHLWLRHTISQLAAKNAIEL